MKSRIAIFVFIMILFRLEPCLAKFNFTVITLEISGVMKKPPYTRIDILMNNDSTALVEVRYKPDKYDLQTFPRTKPDTSYIIPLKRFHDLVENISELSVKQLINGMYPDRFFIWNDPIVFKLTIRVLQQNIVFNMVNIRDYNERNLEPFYEVCKEILTLAKLKPKKYLR